MTHDLNNGRNTKKPEKVILLGAGCGRGMLTREGLAALEQAEVLVYDDLIDPSLLAAVPSSCRKIYAGKRSGAHARPQEEIQQILIEEAEKGQLVVRLKGGDSFVFGRGGEEILALKERGIPVTVIPGVSSCIAVPEHFGIPVTHRGSAQSFTVVTGHTAEGTDENYEALANLRGTLVFLMGIRSLQRITERLISFGKDKDTPSAVLTKGFSAEEGRIDGTLGTIAALAEHAPTPGILVVGETAAMDLRPGASSDTMDLRPGADLCRLADSGPLSGCTVTVTGTPGFTERAALVLEKQGARVDLQPCMEILPLPENIPAVPERGWIVFTSANGIRVFFRHLFETGTDLRALARVRFACIGTGTAEALRKQGFQADLIPRHFTAKALGEELGKQISEESVKQQTEIEPVLILRAETGSPALTEELKKLRIPYKDCAVYRTSPLEGMRSREITTDYIVYGSAGCVNASFPVLKPAEGVTPVCIGEYAAKAFREKTGKEPLTAKISTAEGIAEAICADRKEKTL